MNGRGTRSGRAALVIELTIPGDARLVQTVSAVSVRLAQQVGYAEADAQAIGEAIRQAVASVVERLLHSDPGRSLDIRLATGANDMEISFRYGGAPNGPPEATGTGQPGIPVDAIRRVMPHVEIGRESGSWVCRLARPLPSER